MRFRFKVKRKRNLCFFCSLQILHDDLTPRPWDTFEVKLILIYNLKSIFIVRQFNRSQYSQIIDLQNFFSFFLPGLV